jgi:two-component system sensor histidine kinase RpfC
MTQLLPQFLARYRNRPDSEHRQALVRLALILLIVLYGLFVAPTANGLSEQMKTFFWVCAAGAFVASCLLVAIAFRPGISHVRRLIGMTADFVGMGAAMYLLGELMAPLYIAIVWVTIGNGMRYGPTYLAGASLAACVTFTLVAIFSPFWRAMPHLSGGLALGLLVVPAYLQTLLAALTKATQEAKRSSRAKSIFLANISHELRTPLHGIAGMTQLLGTTPLNAEQNEYIDSLRSSANTLLALVEDVLDISSIEAGKVKVVEFDFSPHELLVSIHRMFLAQAQAKGLSLDIEIAPELSTVVNGDENHLRQILVNLVSNAIKFTDTGGVMLSARLAPASGKSHPDLERAWVQFSVSDTGIGIPEAARARIFNAFEQLDNERTRKYAGTGLGTAISNGLARSLGGQLDYVSVLGTGTTFTLCVPLKLASRSHPMPDPTPAVIPLTDAFALHRAQVSSRRILVCDDHATNRTVIRRLLEKAGHRVLEADGGEQALEILSREEVDLALVDMHMPGIGGVDVLKEARVQQAGRSDRTPMAIISADVTPDAIAAATAAGACAFLPKPVVATRLLQSVSDILLRTASLPDEPPRPALRVFDAQAIEQLRDPSVTTAWFLGFIAQSRTDLDSQLFVLRRAVANHDWSHWRQICHAIKGLSGALGLERASASAHDAMFLDPSALPHEAPRVERTLLAEVRAGYEGLSEYAQALGTDASTG